MLVQAFRGVMVQMHAVTHTARYAEAVKHAFRPA